MDIFGTKFDLTLGGWKLRFVLMLEDEMDEAPANAAREPIPHHVRTARKAAL